MASVKTKVINTETTNPAEFLSGAPVAAASPPTPAAVPPANPVSEPPGSSVPVVTVTPAIPPTADPSAPVRPGLETPAPAATAPAKPFELLAKWMDGTPETGQTVRNLRAMVVPGGCIVELASARGSNFAESICYVPNVVIRNGRLVEDWEGDKEGPKPA